MEEDTATMSSAELPVGNLSRQQVVDETVKASMVDNNITASTMTYPSSTTTITQGTTTITGLEQLEANHEKNQRPSRQSSRARSSRRSRSGRSRSRSRSGRSVSSTNSTSSPGHRVVYSTAAKYDKWVVLILSFPLVLILFQMIVYFIAIAKIADFERSSEVWIMGWTFIFILGLYMAVLPKQVDIRSNGTIGIKTFLATYQFDDICHAYLAGLGPESHSSWIMLGGGRRLRFATCVDPANQVVIRRRGGTDKWDLVVSPQNPDEFLRMMQSLITKLEIQKGTSHNNNNNNNTTTTTTPNTEMSLNGDTTVNSGESSSTENNNVIATMV